VLSHKFQRGSIVPDGALSPPSGTRPGLSGAATRAPTVEVQNLFIVRVTQPQINLCSEDVRGQVLFVLTEISLEGRIYWVDTGLPSLSLSGTVTATPQASTGSVALSHASLGQISTPFKDKYEIGVMIADMQAFVAPTDVDVGSTFIFLGEARSPLLKPIMDPAPALAKVIVHAQHPEHHPHHHHHQHAAGENADVASPRTDPGWYCCDCFDLPTHS